MTGTKTICCADGRTDQVLRPTSSFRIGKDDAAPATTMERLPFAFLLREAIGDRVGSSWVMRKPRMAAIDLDIFNRCGGLFDASLHRTRPCGLRLPSSAPVEFPKLDLNVLTTNYLAQAPHVG